MLHDKDNFVQKNYLVDHGRLYKRLRKRKYLVGHLDMLELLKFSSRRSLIGCVSTY